MVGLALQKVSQPEQELVDYYVFTAGTSSIAAQDTISELVHVVHVL